MGIPFAILLNLVYLDEIIIFVSYFLSFIFIMIYLRLLNYMKERSIKQRNKLIISIIWVGFTGALIGSLINPRSFRVDPFMLGIFAAILAAVGMFILGVLHGMGKIHVSGPSTLREEIAIYVGVFLVTSFVAYIIFGRVIYFSKNVIGGITGFWIGAVYGFVLGRFSDIVYRLNQSVGKIFDRLLTKKSGVPNKLKNLSPSSSTNKITC